MLGGGMAGRACGRPAAGKRHVYGGDFCWARVSFAPNCLHWPAGRVGIEEGAVGGGMG